MASHPDHRTQVSPSRLIRVGLFPLLGSCAVLLLGGGCKSSTSKSSGEALQGSVKIRSNTLSAGDVVSVAFPAAAELNQSQKIRLDGKISLSIIGEVAAAGKSPSSLQAELIAKYGEHLQDPKVIVSLVSSSAVVYVNGEVLTPGKVMLDRPMTVYEVIMESGGFSQVANPKKVILTRQEGGNLVRRELNLKDNSGSGVMYLKPFDTITVSQSWF